jgi:hypothetical protein
MNMRFVKNVRLESLDLRIKKGRSFLMRSKEEIKEVLNQERVALEDIDNSMTEMEWAHNAGWIEALEWVLKKEQMGGDSKDINHILEGANNDTIKRAIKRLSKECGFGRKDHVVNSQNDSVCDSLLYEPGQCSP